MNKNKILSGGGKNLTGGGKWGWRGREVGEEGEGSGVKGGGKWGERGREVGVGYPPVHPLSILFASESQMEPRIQVKLDKYQKCGNIISQTSLLSSYTGSETDADSDSR